MEKRGRNYLKGFSVKRSFNKRVLSNDTEIHEAYQTAQESGKLPFNRTKVLIIGDHDAGKTSTCRRLQGKEFRNDEPSTRGIETNTVEAKVSNVNSKWREVKNTPLEDYESSAAWWAVSRVLNKTATETTNTETSTSIRKITEDTFYLMFYVFPIVIMFSLGGFTFGFGSVVWLYIICIIPATGNVHNAYRFGCGLIVTMVIIDNAINIKEHIEMQSHKVNIWTEMSAVMLICTYGLVALIVGLIVGTGGRTGICIALCFMVHPEQKSLTIENALEKIIFLYNKKCPDFIIFIFQFTITIIIFRLVHNKILSLSRRNALLILVLSIVFISVVIFLGRHYLWGVFTFVCVAVILIFIIGGIIVGRKYVAFGYVPRGYIFMKSVGFLTGLCLGYLCGWEFVNTTYFKLNAKPTHNVFVYILFVTQIAGFIIYEAFVFMKVKNTKSIPINHITGSIEANIRCESYLDARLSLWDFAGQEMYYNTHHLFMPRQGVYLVVFNAIEAVMNPRKQIKRLQFWLQSVAMHAEIENSVVFLVGTRRKHVKDQNLLSVFERLANAHLYTRFAKLLAFHPSGNLIFFIENSLKVDKECNKLREVIYKEINNLKFFHEVFSVRYLLFKETLNSFRRRKCIITTLNEIIDEVNNTVINTKISEIQVRQLLEFFDKSGDVIYNGQDQFLRKYVICDPQVLIDILKHLVNVPEPHRRNRQVADLWQRLKGTGIVDSRLVEHICTLLGIWQMYPYIIRFLVGTNLLLPISITNEIDQVGTFYLCCQLPKLGLHSNINNLVGESQDIYYFDFGEVIIDFLFLRLIGKCCQWFKWFNIYYNTAKFRASKSGVFVIRTHVITGTTDSYERNMIQLIVHDEDKSQSINVLKKMITFIEEIIQQTFNPEYFRNQYICGPKCERCSSSDGSMYLVNLLAAGVDVSTLDRYRIDDYHTVSLKTKLNITCNNPTDHIASHSDNCTRM